MDLHQGCMLRNKLVGIFLGTGVEVNSILGVVAISVGLKEHPNGKILSTVA